jgi:CRISPR-associated protein Csy2
MPTPNQSFENGLLVIPRLKVQGANCVSSPLTWGFPSLTNFAGLMTALERKLGIGSGISFEKFGVICHAFQPLTNKPGYINRFNLTRNPVDQNGDTAGIVEEGRAHMEVSLIFSVKFDSDQHMGAEAERSLAQQVFDCLLTLRIAGGVVHANRSLDGPRYEPQLYLIGENWVQKWRRIKMRLLPGFSLIGREDLLAKKLSELQSTNPEATTLDAWMHESRLNIYATTPEPSAEVTSNKKVAWAAERRAGWIVPIPVGYAAISEQYDPGAVANARDKSVPFRFVESIYSLGEWKGCHKIKRMEDMLWKVNRPTSAGVYKLTNS